jgi:pimeloyl-ACP methyl ester carboxylesterase
MQATRRMLMLVIVLGTAAAGPTAATAAAAKVVKRPVTFKVENLNRSEIGCPSDGAAYEVKGELIGPASKIGADAPEGRHSATLYLHGFGFDGSFWSFSTVPRYDYAAALARSGHVSVVVDRLGYGDSGRPQGNDICLGAQADVAHQIVGKLRAGDYAPQGAGSPRFERVALAGHSLGALIAHVEAFSFEDVDALVAMSYTPQVTQLTFAHFYRSRVVCDAGGEPATAGGPGGYAYFTDTAAEFDALVFHSAEPAVRETATRLRARDPCGDGDSIVGGLVQDLKSLSRVKVPVLVVCGTEDAATPSFACPFLKRRYVGSSNASLAFIRNAGHALTLERTAPKLRRRVGAWLGARGF